MSTPNASIAFLSYALLTCAIFVASCASEGQRQEREPYVPQSNEQAAEEEAEQDVWDDINR